MTPTPTPQGKILKGRYRIVELREETDRFLVFDGQRLEQGERSAGRAASGDVCVKVLKDPVPEGFLELYNRELAITHRLSSDPRILKYHDVDVIENRYCVVTESFPHPSLQRLLNERRRVGYAAVLSVLKTLAQVLEAAQMEGLSERHVRYDDVLVDAIGGVTRIAKLSIPRSLAVVGAAPSKRAWAGVTRDLFFVGCTLYRLVVLEYPFGRAHSSESVAAETLETALKAHYPEVGPAEILRLLLFFKRCTTAEMGQRFSTYDDVLKELDNVECLNAGILASHRQIEERSRRKKRVGSLQTAFDTVAALRGELLAPPDEVPAPGTLGARLAAARGAAVPPPERAPAPAPAAGGGPLDQTMAVASASSEGESVPSRKELGALLWDRVRQAEGNGTIAWDDPAVTKMMLTGSILLFVGMLLWLLFGH